MTNRRRFLQTSMAISALPLNGFLEALPADSKTQSAQRPAIRKAIFDPRYAECTEFATVISEFGVPVASIANGDPTDVWFNELDLMWSERPVPIAGLTQFGPMFALRSLAQDRGMRVALRIRHHVSGSGIAHSISGSAEQIAMAERLAMEGMDWPTLAAALAAHCREVPRNPLSRTVLTRGRKPALRQDTSVRPETIIHYYLTSAVQKGGEVPLDGPLVSWVLAPYERPATHYETT